MPDSEFNDQLIKALDLYRGDLLRDIPGEEVIQREQIFSAGFEKKMKKLIHRAAKTPQQARRHLAGQVAVIILVVTLVFVPLMSVEAIRTPVIHFLTEVYETSTRIVFCVEDREDITAIPEEIEQVYLPGFVPEGFELEVELLDTSYVIFSYARGEDRFEWTQYCLNEALYMDTEGTELEKVISNGLTYLYYENKGRGRLVWEQNGYSFTCAGTLPRMELLQIAESIK